MAAALRRVLAWLVLLALVGAGAAFAAKGDPQKKINAADQARAKAMLVRKSDFPGFKASPTGSSDDAFYCRAVDESDLTLTGEAESPQFANPLVFVASYSQVYESRVDADASWRRGTSPAGVACLREGLRRQIESGGDTFISLRKLAFQRRAERSAAFRVVGSTQGIRIYMDFVVLMQSRAHVGVVVTGAARPVARGETVSLVTVLSARMKTAMRGA